MRASYIASFVLRSWLALCFGPHPYGWRRARQEQGRRDGFVLVTGASTCSRVQLFGLGPWLRTHCFVIAD